MGLDGIFRWFGLTVAETILESKQINIAEARLIFGECGLSIEEQRFPHFPSSELPTGNYEHHVYFERLHPEPFDNNGGHLVGTYVHQAKCVKKEGGVWRPGKPEKREFRISYSVKS